VTNLLLVSVVSVAKLAAGVVDTGGKFTTCLVDTSGKFATGVVNAGDKFVPVIDETGGAPWLASISNVIFRGLCEYDSWKEPEAKNLVTLSLEI
jgi:hypothetical protein